MNEPKLTYARNQKGEIVFRVFDENYKTSHQAAHIVLINSMGYISREVGRESGEQLYSWRYTYARGKSR